MIKHWYLLILAGIAAAGSAAIHHVEPGMSIQEAVNGSQNGDTILIHEGDYSETTVLYGKSVTIGSLYLLDGDTCHRDATTIGPNVIQFDTQSCFVYSYGETELSRLSGLTVRYGHGTRWNHGEYSELAGGAIHIRNASLRLDQCRISQSFSEVGGGLTLISDSGSAILEAEGCSFQDCNATGSSYASWGGGVYTDGSRATFNDCTFRNNLSDMQGFGIFAIGGVIAMQNCFFTENFGFDGAASFSVDSLSIAGCHFLDNRTTALETDLLVITEGWGIADVRGNLFESTEWTCGTDAICLWQASGSSRIDFVGNIIRNYSAYCGSGQVLLNNFHSGEFSHNIFANNINLASPVWVYALADCRLHHNVFINNTSIQEYLGSWCGSVLTQLPMAHVSLDSNWFAGNSGFLIGDHGSDCSLFDSITAENNWWGHASGPYHETLNPNGQGDTLCNDNVDFFPWLTEPPDTSLTAGLTPQNPAEVPRRWELTGIHPNPFNYVATIDLAGFTGNDFEIDLHNLLGQVVDVIHRGPLSAGQLHYKAPAWLASGVYFVKAADRTSVQTRKVVLLK